MSDLSAFVSLQCQGDRHHACRPDEWACACPCHLGSAEVASDDDSGSHGPPRPAPGSSSDGASGTEVASTDPVAGTEPPPVTVHGAGSVDGVAEVHRHVFGEVHDGEQLHDAGDEADPSGLTVDELRPTGSTP